MSEEHFEFRLIIYPVLEFRIELRNSNILSGWLVRLLER